MMVAGVLGFLALLLSWGVIMPASRTLILKLGTLSDMARRARPELYRERLQEIDPHDGPKFRHNRVTRMLRADMSDFGEICQRLQQEARKLDRRVHLGLLPIAIYAIGLAAWRFL
jgi:hypothetical protein